MKIFSKIILGLSLSIQAFAAPLEARQGTGTVTTVDAAVNRLLNNILTEVYSLNTALTGLGMPNPTGTLATAQNGISSLTTNIGGASSIISSATGMASCTAANSGSITTFLTNLGMVQILVTTLSITLSTALSSLSAGDVATLGSNVTGLETAINGLNINLQAYGQNLLPCVSTATPTLVQPIELALTNLGNTVQSLLTQLGVGGVLNGLITSLIP